tara:strand:+ start:60 stop:341 length:282 start_codon:yes stop_codon:yes gene_type:complete
MKDLHMNGRVDYINVTPSWEGIFRIMLETWSSQSNQGKIEYQQEIRRVATILDGIEPLVNALRPLIDSQPDELTPEWEAVAKAIQDIVDASEL